MNRDIKNAKSLEDFKKRLIDAEGNEFESGLTEDMKLPKRKRKWQKNFEGIWKKSEEKEKADFKKNFPRFFKKNDA